MPIHWRSQIDIDEENRYGHSDDGPQPPADDSAYQQPEYLKHLRADELLIRLRKALDPVREDDLRHDADMERDGNGEEA